MPKYLYILNAEKSFTEAELSIIKDEICGLFKCTEISVAGTTGLTVHSPLNPTEVETVLKELSRKFRVQFAAGGKMD